jgi:hypothetical protein
MSYICIGLFLVRVSLIPRARAEISYPLTDTFSRMPG